MPLLSEFSSTDTNESFFMNLHVEIGKVTCQGISVEELDNNTFIIKLGDYAIYYVDGKDNRIRCLATSFESFFSTLFNIPFSLFFASKGWCLFHACSLLREKTVICISGDKGVGKTTLSYLLAGDQLKLYSDDTLLIRSKTRPFRAHNLMKLTDQSVSELNIFDVNKERNIIGKRYYSIDDTKIKPSRIESIIFLRRTSDNKPWVEPIKLPAIKKGMLYHNIVGIGVLPYSIIKRIDMESLFSDIPVSFLHIPSNFETLKKVKNDIESLVLGG